MKKSAKYSALRLSLFVLACAILGGCGGYARQAGSSSRVEAYGVINVGVVHESR
jgi:hypothetical protein